MHANLASIMPQVLAVWCEEEGHDVRLVCYTGFEDLLEELPDDIDLLFVGAFSQTAQLAYAISAMFRGRGVVTCIGGPHARCYPEDSQKYFDYVLGFTDRPVLQEVLGECAPQRPLGRALSAAQQPSSLPGVQERWKYIEATLAKSPALKIVPMLGSLGCPYTCSFCIDSEVPFRPLDFGQMRDDLRFLLGKFKRPRVAWHDPNFGVRFDDCLGAIEEAIPSDSIDFIAESSLSLLSEPRLVRMRKNGFRALLPGVESWYELGNKAKTGGSQGLEKVALPAGQHGARSGWRCRSGAVRSHETVRGSLSGSIPRVLPVDGVRKGGAPQPRVSEERQSPAFPVSLPQQSPCDERRAAELRVARVLRPRDRPDEAHLLEAGDRAPSEGEP